jgi:hypothetical protein
VPIAGGCILLLAMRGLAETARIDPDARLNPMTVARDYLSVAIISRKAAASSRSIFAGTVQATRRSRNTPWRDLRMTSPGSAASSGCTDPS